jgi:hypothetical protein
MSKLRLYCIPWVSIDKFAEFRVFVFDKKITGISQQHLYESNKLIELLIEKKESNETIEPIETIEPKETKELWELFEFGDQEESKEQKEVEEPDPVTKLINKWVKIIYDYFESNIKNNYNCLNSYVYDFAILSGDKPYFIEFNPFGKEYSSGSSLFHWIDDESKLLNRDNRIYFRYSLSKK